MKIRLSTFAAIALAALGSSTAARAHGDPASDYLLAQQVFVAFDAKLPAGKQQQLVNLVAAANRAGYRIRVALISDSPDLGPDTELWRRPRTYARFLGAELRDGYKQRLLVVMPNGFGFNRTGHATTREYVALDKIAIAPGATGLADGAETAVRRLAALDGVTVVPAPVVTPAHRNARDRKVIVLISAASIAVAMLVRLALRSRSGDDS